ncbi:acyltransferase [Anaeromyxobacter sp. SG17]|uniref:acyltransferase family protein n=1 Tax=Anaeromyxobacter sp. SG17 TaxID=2925405 RepID=UPI001F592E3C|nr:acyltransferase [Anaeromyxobacter sp. SG17]
MQHASAASSSPGRIPSLDGLRAISIIGVLVAHSMTAGTRESSTVPSLGWLVQSLGHTGVTVFFGISGFLITTLLAREDARNGCIDLGAFYRRRAFRILPAYWVYLAAISLIAPELTLPQFARSFLFLTDLAPTHSWWLDHSWSLSVEEQFYLAWPLAVAVLGIPRARRAIVMVLLAYPVVRVLLHALVFAPRGKHYGFLHLRFDTILFGCLLALLHAHSPDHLLLRFLRRGWVAALAALFLALVSPVFDHMLLTPYYDYIGGAWVGSLAVGSLILWAVHNSGSRVGLLLNSRPAVHVGVISYSLYLWQQPFFAPGLPSVLSFWPVNFLAAFFAAELSYRFVEQPLLRVRDKILVRRAAGGTAIE